MSLIRVFGQKAQMARNPWRRGGYYIRSDLVPWIKQGFQGLSGPQKRLQQNLQGRHITVKSQTKSWVLLVVKYPTSPSAFRIT